MKLKRLTVPMLLIVMMAGCSDGQKDLGNNRTYSADETIGKSTESSEKQSNYDKVNQMIHDDLAGRKSRPLIFYHELDTEVAGSGTRYDYLTGIYKIGYQDDNRKIKVFDIKREMVQFHIVYDGKPHLIWDGEDMVHLYVSPENQYQKFNKSDVIERK